MEQFIPIDIHIAKLLDWLVSRRHCNNDWAKNVIIIREKINAAIQDMPAHEGIIQLLSGTYINYFHCLRIIEILKETEADTKSFFGSYGSKRMKDWQEIVRLYQKDNIYLAEASNLLIRNIKYEIPALKKQISKCQQTQQECEKKEAQHAKTAKSAQNEINNLKKQLGIQSDNIQQDLSERIKTLPEIYDRIASKVKSVLPAVSFYTKFVEENMEMKVSVTLINFVADRGNATTYEWQYDEAPSRIEGIETNIVVEENNEEDDGGGIDWGDDTFTDEIDYGISVEADPNQSDVLMPDDSGIDVEKSKDKVARGEEALTVLDNPKTRNQFLNEIMELESFLKMRLHEMKSDDGGLISDVSETPENVKYMLDAVITVQKLLTDKTTEHLHNVKHLPKYVENFVKLLKNKKNVIEKAKTLEEELQRKSREAAQEELKLKAKLALINQKTKDLQVEIAADISKKYKDRPVNLMGGVQVNN
nr:PREDICTED: CDK5 regulatory subunit-associated protein 3 [Bemisia tabaci]